MENSACATSLGRSFAEWNSFRGERLWNEIHSIVIGLPRGVSSEESRGLSNPPAQGGQTLTIHPEESGRNLRKKIGVSDVPHSTVANRAVRAR
jgi:hypothetical protein